MASKRKSDLSKKVRPPQPKGGALSSLERRRLNKLERYARIDDILENVRHKDEARREREKLNRERRLDEKCQFAARLYGEYRVKERELREAGEGKEVTEKLWELVEFKKVRDQLMGRKKRFKGNFLPKKIQKKLKEHFLQLEIPFLEDRKWIARLIRWSE